MPLYAHRVMRHLCTANREWLATTLLSTTESRRADTGASGDSGRPCVHQSLLPGGIGPLTNIALLLSQCPECKPYIRRLVIMGGFCRTRQRYAKRRVYIVAD